MDTLGLVIILLLALAFVIIILQSRASSGYDLMIKSDQEDFKRSLKRVESYLAGHKRVTEEQIKDELGIRNGLAVKCLEELERRGVLKKVKENGRFICYEKVSE